MPYRVIQWYTGSIASEQLRLIARHPELTLAGAVVHHEEKVGRDAGEIAGIAPLGVKAVGNGDEALGLDADVVLYNSPFARAPDGRKRAHAAVLERPRSARDRELTFANRHCGMA